MSRIKVTYAISPTVDFYSDPQRVEIILNHILSNSLKYHDAGKSFSYVHVNVNIKPDCCEIRVEDNGIGIREEYIKNILDIFYRADENAKGSGLGLYIAKNTASKIGGMITIQSEYGKGSTFIVMLPNLFKEPLQNLIFGSNQDFQNFKTGVYCA